MSGSGGRMNLFVYEIIKVSAFIIHFVASIFLVIAFAKCGSSFLTDLYTEGNHGYPVIGNYTCTDHSDKSCFFGLPQTFDMAQRSLQLNVFAILAAFEWISASFALAQLYLSLSCWFKPILGDFNFYMVGLLWNLAGLVLFIPSYGTPLSVLQLCIFTLAFLAACVVQRDCLHIHNPVVLHYAEYCTSASLLIVAVLILYITDPPSWAAIIGFLAIFLCNISGVAAHLCRQYEMACNNPGPSIFDLDWGKACNHFKLYFFHGWLCLLVAVSIIVYLASNSFSNSNIPWWVRFILINLLVTYTLFGVWASLCYFMAGRNPQSTWDYLLPEGLTILSISAKIPIAFTVFYGLLQEPGGKALCSVF